MTKDDIQRFKDASAALRADLAAFAAENRPAPEPAPQMSEVEAELRAAHVLRKNAGALSQDERAFLLSQVRAWKREE